MVDIGGIVQSAARPALSLGAGAALASAAVGGFVLLDPDGARAAEVAGLYQQGLLLVAFAGMVPAAVEIAVAGWAMLRGRPVPAFKVGLASTIGGMVGAVAGAFIGNMLIRRADEALRPGRYAERHARIDAALDRARDVLRRHGVDDEHGLEPIDVEIDDTYINAAFVPPRLGAAADHLRIGRSHITGESYSLAPDVIHHELGHRIVDRYRPAMSSGTGQVQTVNESLADTIAAAIDDDWTFGEDVAPLGTRSMERPDDPAYVDAAHLDARGGEPYPAHRSQLHVGSLDQGGAHVNVGVPNRAAFLIGSQLGREAMLAIYLRALEHDLAEYPDIGDLARAVRAATDELHGPSSHQRGVVDAAWESVGYETG